MAKTFKKPVYAAAQRSPFQHFINSCLYCLSSFIFTRLYPLSQDEIPDNASKSPYNTDTDLQDLQKDFPEFNVRYIPLYFDCYSLCKVLHPILDYTPPSFLTLLFTDLGVLTPSAVSDELIKLYS